MFYSSFRRFSVLETCFSYPSVFIKKLNLSVAKRTSSNHTSSVLGSWSVEFIVFTARSNRLLLVPSTEESNECNHSLFAVDSSIGPLKSTPRLRQYISFCIEDRRACFASWKTSLTSFITYRISASGVLRLTVTGNGDIALDEGLKYSLNMGWNKRSQSFLVGRLQGNIMDEVNIEDLTIEQYFIMTQESQIPKKVDDITIAEYLEYKEAMKTQDYGEYQPHSAKANVLTTYRDHLSLRHKSLDPLLDTKTNPYLHASQSPVHSKITKTTSKYTREVEEQSNRV
ncbi:hypothetical protein Tco_1254883 [Tanacetum coccineum]